MKGSRRASRLRRGSSFLRRGAHAGAGMIQRLLLLAVALSACGGEDARPEKPVDPQALLSPGPHAVGYRHTEITYTPRGRTEERTLPLEIWYPATPGTGSPTTYHVAGVVDVPREGVATDAGLEAGAPLPVLVYSHGNGGVGLVAFSYGERFASHGWLVLAMDHVGNTIIDGSNAFALDLLVRPQDVSAVLDWAEQPPAPFTGHVSRRVLALGHSFGAYSVLSLAGARRDVPGDTAACDRTADGSCALLADPAVATKLEAGFRDPRVDAVVAQAGVFAGYAAGSLEAIDLPVMLQSGRLDATVPWDPNATGLWNATGKAWIDLLGGGHYSFLEICDQVDPAIFSLAGIDVVHDGCGPGFTPPSEIVPVLEAYALAFGQSRVLGDGRYDQVLSGDALHSDVVVTLRP
jgi:predicted dienelactone hydrolase